VKGRAVFILALLALAGPALAQKAIDFTLSDLDGRPVSLADFRDKSVVLIDFWATWCVPCIKELAHFQRFQEQYADKGLAILAITVDGPDTVAHVQPFLKRYNYTFPVLFDTDSRVIALYDPRVVMPSTFLVDKNGAIRYVHQGYSPGDEKVLEAEILKLLEPAAPRKEHAVSVQGTEAFLNRDFSDNTYVDRSRGGRASQIINQLDLAVSGGRFLAGARVDAYLDFSPVLDDYSLAKRFAEYNSRSVSLRAGDFYQTLGRGLAFSLLKTFEQEGLEYIIDTTVDGGKAAFSLNRFSAELFGGWITRDKPPQDSTPAVRDTVLGGTAGLGLGRVGTVRANFLDASVDPGTLLGTRHATMESVSFEVPNWKDRFKFYGEFLLLQKTKHFVEEKFRGHGAYLEGGLFVRNWTFLLEFKDYRNLTFEYNRPPLLESELIPIVANQFIDSADDVTGVGVRVDRYFSQVSTLLFAKWTYQDDRRETPGRRIVHFFTGYEKKFREKGWLTLLAGYRRETSSSPVFWDTAGRTLHGQGNLSYPLTARLSLEADLEVKDFHGDLAFGGRFYDYGELRSYFSVHYSPRWIMTALYDWTTDPKILSYKDKKKWWGAQLEWKFSQRSALRIFYGANKGGVKCAGGICRFFPPFEGLRVDALVWF
jgi:peroxiredoxin